MREFVRTYIMTRMFGERIASIAGIAVIILVVQDFVVFFLAAFLCAYLFRLATEWSRDHLHTLAEISPKQFKSIILWISKEKILLTMLYILFA